MVSVAQRRSRHRYNGCEAVVGEGPNDKGRYEVHFRHEGKEVALSVKPDNIILKPSSGWEIVALALSAETSARDVFDVFAKYAIVKGCDLILPAKDV